MKTFDVQSIALRSSLDRAFDFIAAPENLPKWTRAFESVKGAKTLLRSPAGSVEIELAVEASRKYGTIDWRMTFSDGSIASAYSRLVSSGPDSCLYSFILTAPPVPLEQIEGALEQQSRILAEELSTLNRILEQSSGGA